MFKVWTTKPQQKNLSFTYTIPSPNLNPTSCKPPIPTRCIIPSPSPNPTSCIIPSWNPIPISYKPLIANPTSCTNQKPIQTKTPNKKEETKTLMCFQINELSWNHLYPKLCYFFGITYVKWIILYLFTFCKVHWLSILTITLISKWLYDLFLSLNVMLWNRRL